MKTSQHRSRTLISAPRRQWRGDLRRFAETVQNNWCSMHGTILPCPSDPAVEYGRSHETACESKETYARVSWKPEFLWVRSCWIGIDLLAYTTAGPNAHRMLLAEIKVFGEMHTETYTSITSYSKIETGRLRPI